MGGELVMEKVIWVRSYGKLFGSKGNDDLDIVNKYLEEGWKVKHISACAAGDNINSGQAYIVIEKDVD
jgi:hypothetical protein